MTHTLLCLPYSFSRVGARRQNHDGERRAAEELREDPRGKDAADGVITGGQRGRGILEWKVGRIVGGDWDVVGAI